MTALLYIFGYLLFGSVVAIIMAIMEIVKYRLKNPSKYDVRSVFYSKMENGKETMSDSFCILILSIFLWPAYLIIVTFVYIGRFLKAMCHFPKKAIVYVSLKIADSLIKRKNNKERPNTFMEM